MDEPKDFRRCEDEDESIVKRSWQDKTEEQKALLRNAFPGEYLSAEQEYDLWITESAT